MEYKYVYGRFRRNGKIYCWECPNKINIRCGDKAVVDSAGARKIITVTKIENCDNNKNCKKVIDIMKRKMIVVPIFMLRVPQKLRNSTPNNKKYENKRKQFNNNTIKPVYINKDLKIVDGYITYLLAKENHKLFVRCTLSNKSV